MRECDILSASAQQATHFTSAFFYGDIYQGKSQTITGGIELQGNRQIL